MADMILRRWTGLATAVAVIGLAAIAPPAQAEPTSGSLEDFNLTSWTDANGLPPGRIRDLTQDAAGYLWIASDSGLVRFDGLSFELWNARFTPAIPSGPAGAVLSAPDGSLWIGISGKTPVGRIHGGQLTLFGAPEGLGPGYTRSLVRDHAGVMWAATSSGLYRFESRRWHRVGESEGLPDGATLAVFEDSARRLWVGTTSAIYRRARAGPSVRARGRHRRVEQLVAELQRGRARPRVHERFHQGLSHARGRGAGVGASRVGRNAVARPAR